MNAFEAYRRSEEIIALNKEMGQLSSVLAHDPVLESRLHELTGVINISSELTRVTELLSAYRTELINAMKETTLQGRHEP